MSEGVSQGRVTGQSLAGPDSVGPGVASPCISVCRMNAQTGLCEGCLRTLDEIAAWSTMADDDKRRIWALLPQRQAQAGASTTDKPA